MGLAAFQRHRFVLPRTVPLLRIPRQLYPSSERVLVHPGSADRTSRPSHPLKVVSLTAQAQ
jgi:hypothetical protein